ncbi:putative metal-dependent hydrolase [Mucilaginibacter sp. HMF5004]|uniref:YfiT family bacillithiol transferase n=1 Tax=Mucilaginibacter rivuli TaxID=2857527 RepID=UPI001C5EAA26|nr:putative metal-dependent hydrolase [Mucilaginibacter rivuli]MBW4890168.1 putative metal-dependent hydrolase [Mucilaginibacter rivuli]
MSTAELDALRFPIGKFTPPSSYTEQQMQQWIADIKELPAKLRVATMSLSEAQLDTPYRPGGWTIRQVVHHVSDSHINALVRFKLALTEDNPTIKPYEEADWALLADSKLPIEPSLQLIDALHNKWVALLESLNEEQWDRTFVHPESGATTPLRRNLGMYAWHGNHHLAHITGVKF